MITVANKHTRSFFAIKSASFEWSKPYNFIRVQMNVHLIFVYSKHIQFLVMLKSSITQIWQLKDKVGQFCNSIIMTTVRKSLSVIFFFLPWEGKEGEQGGADIWMKQMNKIMNLRMHMHTWTHIGNIFPCVIRLFFVTSIDALNFKPQMQIMKQIIYLTSFQNFPWIYGVTCPLSPSFSPKSVMLRPLKIYRGLNFVIVLI